MTMMLSKYLITVNVLLAFNPYLIWGKNARNRENLDTSFLEASTRYRSIQQRILQDNAAKPKRACSQVITTFTASEIKSVAEMIINSALQEQHKGSEEMIYQTLLGEVRYDLQVTKECSSCASLRDIYGTALDETGFNDYCGEGMYGFDAQHSTMVMTPIDPETGLVMQGQKVRGVMVMHGTYPVVSDANTESFPANVTEYLAGLVSPSDFAAAILYFDHFIAGIVTASAGAVGLFPDFIGYGESAASHNRTYYVKELYMQAAAVAWLGAKKTFNGHACVLDLDNNVTVTGLSEGSYAAINAAVALDQLGVDILSLTANSGVYSLEITFSDLIEKYESGDINNISPIVAYFGAAVFGLLAFAYSQQDNDFLDLQGQAMVSAAYWNASDSERFIADWFRSGLDMDRPSFMEKAIMALPYPPDVLNQVFLGQVKAKIANNLESSCGDGLIVEGETDRLCRAIMKNSVIDVMERLTFPTFICHSPDDAFVTIKNIPPLPHSNPFVQAYESSIPGLNPRGDHIEAEVLCNFGPMANLGATAGTEQSPVLMTPFTCEEEKEEQQTSPTAGNTTLGGNTSHALENYGAMNMILAWMVVAAMWFN